MSLLAPTEQKHQIAAERAIRRTYRSREEIAIREALEVWCRARYSGARLYHELVIQTGIVRADLAAIQPDHLAIFEIKGPHDDTSRLIRQVALFRLAAPELWVVADARHLRDAEVIRFLLPTVGILAARGVGRAGWSAADDIAFTEVSLDVVAEAEPFAPLPEAMLQMLWAQELWAEASRHQIVQGGRKWTRGRIIDALLGRLSFEEQVAAVCRQLRRRDTLYRADPPVSPNDQDQACVESAI